MTFRELGYHPRCADVVVNVLVMLADLAWQDGGEGTLTAAEHVHGAVLVVQPSVTTEAQLLIGCVVAEVTSQLP